MQQDVFTVKETMQILRISRSHVYRLLGSEIPIIRMGRKILVPAKYIRKLIEEPLQDCK